MQTRKKWTIFGAVLTGILLASWFLTRVSDAPRGSMATKATPASAPDAPAENKDHEMKMLVSELERKPDHVPVLIRLAQLSRETGRAEDAVGYLRRAVAHEPGNIEARLELGRALYENGDVPGAISETQKILQTDPKHVDALYNMGAIYANLGDTARARNYWTAAVEAAPNSDSGGKARDGLRQLGGPPPKS